MKTILVLLSFSLFLAAVAAEKLMDDRFTAKAEVVLRVNRLGPGEGSKYLWYPAEVLQVLKNQSGGVFTNRLSVAACSGKGGVLEGESTIYLEPYDTNRSMWKLVGGEAFTGVAHVKKNVFWPTLALSCRRPAVEPAFSPGLRATSYPGLEDGIPLGCFQSLVAQGRCRGTFGAILNHWRRI